MLWRSMTHIFVAQAVMVWIYIIWPLLSKFLGWLDRRYRVHIEDDTEFKHQETRRKQAYRGKWRDYQDQSAQQRQQQEQTQAKPDRQPLTPRAAHLATLGLDRMADAKTHRRAYRRLAKKWHPDRFATGKHSDAERETATEKMTEINEAYDWLVENPL